MNFENKKAVGIENIQLLDENESSSSSYSYSYSSSESDSDDESVFSDEDEDFLDERLRDDDLSL